MTAHPDSRSVTSLHERLSRGDVVVLDGGLATALEDRGHDLGDDLWSARLLVDHPDVIRAVHADYVAAGAHVVTTATYQASADGLRQRGLDARGIGDLFASAVELAREARGDADVLIAASVGPYGATLADGSEYSGDYGKDGAFLEDWHGARLELLSVSGADLLAIETIPSLLEAEALLRCLDRIDGPEAWISFSAKDGVHISDGTSFATCVEQVGDHRRIVAVGVNCTAPGHVASLLNSTRSSLPLVAYANSGERWDAGGRRWVGDRDPGSYAGLATAWRDAGARLIGGCCRTGPGHIKEIAKALR